MNPTDSRITQILLTAGVINAAQVKRMQAEQVKWGGKLHCFASELGFAKEDTVASTLARALKLPRLRLSELPVEADAMKRLTGDICERLVVYPCALRDDGKTLWLAMSDPLDVSALDDVRVAARVTRVAAGVAGKKEILDAVYRAYTILGHTDSGDDSISLRSDDEEFKVTDLSGRTQVKHINDIKPRPGRTPEPVAAPVSAAAPSGNVAEQLAELQAAHAQTQQVLQVMFDLCLQKGVFTMEEYRALLGRG